jgi:hypothetical protein
VQPLALVVIGLAIAGGLAAIADRTAGHSPKSHRAVLALGVALVAGAIVVALLLPVLRLDRLYTLGMILGAGLWVLAAVAGAAGVVMLAGGILATRHALARRAARSPGARTGFVAGGVAAVVACLGLLFAASAARDFTLGAVLAAAAVLSLAAGVAMLASAALSKRAGPAASRPPPSR